MPNAFVLHGELKADTANFERSLKNADQTIKATERNLTQLEQKTRSYGNTSAVTARQQERVNETIRAQKTRLQDAVHAYDSGIISHKKMASVLTQTDSRMSALNSKIKDQSARLKDWHAGNGAVTGSLSGLNGILGAMGLSLSGMAIYTGKAAIAVDNWKNILTAATGSSEAARAKLAELNAVAKQSPGVMTETAVSTYALLKPMQIAEGTINSLIQAFGRIKLALPTADMSKFAFNLNQLGSTFDKTDFKEAIENFPRFGEIVKKAFDLKSAQDDIEGLLKELRKLKEEGKLTKETWLKGIAEGINKDESLGKLGDTLGTKIEKMFENIKMKLAPIGETFLDPFLAEIDKESPNFQEMGAKMGDRLGMALAEAIQNKQGVIESAANAVGQSASLAIVKGLMTVPAKSAEYLGWMLATITGYQMKFYSAAFEIGASISGGIVAGIRSKAAEAAAAASSLASQAIIGAQNKLMIRSPSKVFHAIGEQVGQGFIDGLASMRTGVYKAMADLVDISGIKALTKNDTAAVSWLTSLINDLDALTERTNVQKALLKLQTAEFRNANEEIKKKILLLETEKDRLADIKKFYDAIGARFGSMMNTDIIGESSGRLDQEAGALSSPGVTDIADNVPDPPEMSWRNFWQMMRLELAGFKGSLPSMKEAIGVNLIDSISRIGDVFGNAIRQWDGTAKGFFRSLRDGFRDLVSQLVSELVRLMVIKAVMSLIGSVAGAGSGGSGGGAYGGWGIMTKAGGGAVNGPGTSTSDSIPAMLSNGEYVVNAKAVSKWGRGFFDQLNSMSAPRMAFAGGGMVGSTYNSSSYGGHTVNVYMSGGGAHPRETADQISRAVIQRLEKTQRRSGL